MARKPRIHFPGAVYHVIFRGNAGQPVFSTDEDRTRFFLLLQEGTCRFGYRVHGFCLMHNHIHMALQVGQVPLSIGMQNLAFRFTRWMNLRLGRTGHLFQGRYKAILVDADAYLLQLVRYLHYNPVRVGLVMMPADYCWSSHRAYLGEERLPWLTTELVLAQFQPSLAQARVAYTAFMSAGREEGFRKEFQNGSHANRLLGDDRFAENVLTQVEGVFYPSVDVERLQELVLEEFDCTLDALGTRSQRHSLALARAMMGWLAVQSGAATLTDVGGWFGRDVVTMSAAVRRLAERAERCVELREVMARLQATLASKATGSCC